ncbi:MAG: asparaginase, partial [Limnobacter sp.]|nr:asparaginase [Limnobacter sp.]
MGSQHATLREFLLLRQAVIKCLKDDQIHGVLITHGTDTMEEAIYFLYATLPPAHQTKPILFTGAMHASDHPEADGPQNLLGSAQILSSIATRGFASAVADSKGAGNSGRLQNLMALCMARKLIFPPRVSKSHTQSVNAFASSYQIELPENDCSGALELLDVALASADHLAGAFSGLKIFEDKVSIDQCVDALQAVQVELLFCRPDTVSINKKVQEWVRTSVGVVVVATYGNGNIPVHWVEDLKWLMTKGVRVVRASRVGAGGVSNQTEPTELDWYETTMGKNGLPIYEKAPDPLSLPQLLLHERLKYFQANEGSS